MKKLISIYLFVVLAFATTEAQTVRNLSSFSSVSVHEGIDVVMKKGKEEKAVILSCNKPESEVLTEVIGDHLKIHLEGNNHRNVKVQMEVTFKELKGLKVSSSGTLKVTDKIVSSGNVEVGVSSSGSIDAKVQANKIEVSASSAGDVELHVEADELTAGVSSAGEIEVTGTVRYQHVKASSAGTYAGMGVSGEEAEVKASSAGSIKVNISEKITARASSGGSVRYSGAPGYVNANSSSGGSVKKS